MSTDPGQTRTSAEPHGQGSGSTTSSDSFDHGRIAPGTLLSDRYRIVGRLGVGGWARCRADDLKIGQAVALKCLPEEFERDAERREKFMGEIRAARQISPRCARVQSARDPRSSWVPRSHP